MQSKLITTTLCSILVQFALGQCSSDGAKSPTAMLSDASIGTLPLVNLTGAGASDDTYAAVTALALGDETNYLVSNDFEFSIPSTATICGIEVRIERHASGLLQNVHDNALRLMKGGAFVGTDKASAAAWPTSDSYATYGGSSDTWGTTWTPSDVNDSTFGVGHSINLAGVSVLPTARIDHTSTSVYYSMPLPVGLVYFVATRSGSQVTLQWSTSSELNNDRFEVEFSKDGINWMVQNIVDGAGTATMSTDYSMDIRNDFEQPTFYRLKQCDFDGVFEYSKTVSVKGLSGESGQKFEVFKQGNGYVIASKFPTQEVRLISTAGLVENEALRISESKFYLEAPNLLEVLRIQWVGMDGESSMQQLCFVD